jgi:formate/nitrite transporter FocA (FNT family)
MARKPLKDTPPEVEERFLEDDEEHEEAHRRSAPRAEIVYEAVRREGEHELARPVVALAWSGLAAGLSMGFSFLTQALLTTYLPQQHWNKIIADLGYSVGFLIVILGRQQLFTENTLTPVLVLLRNKDLETLGRVLRLWVVVLIANTAGAFVFALLLAKTPLLDPAMHRTLIPIGQLALSTGFGATLVRGVFAGWLIALLIWLLPFAETARVSVIIIITYVIALGHFSHIIASAVEAFYTVLRGGDSWMVFFDGFYAPTLLGNIAGGVALVAVVNYAQLTVIKKEVPRGTRPADDNAADRPH